MYKDRLTQIEMRRLYRTYFVCDVIFWIIQLHTRKGVFLESVASVYNIVSIVDRVKVVILIHLLALACYLFIMIFVKIFQLPITLTIILRGFGYVMLATVLVVPCCRLIEPGLVMQTYVLLELTICMGTLLNYAFCKTLEQRENKGGSDNNE